MSTLEEKLDRVFETAKIAHNEDRDAATAELLSSYWRHRPGHASAWHLYGDALRVLGLFHEAKRALTTAYELKPSGWIAGRLAQLHNDHGELAEAERWYAIATADKEAATRNWMWIMRGANLAQMNQLQEAEACHRKALVLDGTLDGEANLNLGYVLRAQGQYAEAAQAFGRSLQIDPNNVEVQKARKSLEGIDEAATLAREIASLVP